MLHGIDEHGDEEFVFEATYVSGTPALRSDSIEASETTVSNTYEPMWFSIKRLSTVMVYPVFVREYLKARFTLR